MRLIQIASWTFRRPRYGSSHFENLHGYAECRGSWQISVRPRDRKLRLSQSGVPSSLDFGVCTEIARGWPLWSRGTSPSTKRPAAAITSSRRSVLRVRGYFATVYAVGCLAIRFKILPFTEAELLTAVRPAIAITLPSSKMKLLVAPSGQLSPLALTRSLPHRISGEADGRRRRSRRRPPSIGCGASSIITAEARLAERLHRPAFAPAVFASNFFLV